MNVFTWFYLIFLPGMGAKNRFDPSRPDTFFKWKLFRFDDSHFLTWMPTFKVDIFWFSNEPLCQINNFSLIAMDIIIFEELWILNGCNDSDIFSLLTHDRLFLCFPWKLHDLYYLISLKVRFWAKHATTYVSSAKNE